jgi:hypothetical protein
MLFPNKYQDRPDGGLMLVRVIVVVGVLLLLLLCTHA